MFEIVNVKKDSWQMLGVSVVSLCINVLIWGVTLKQDFFQYFNFYQSLFEHEYLYFYLSKGCAICHLWGNVEASSPHHGYCRQKPCIVHIIIFTLFFPTKSDLIVVYHNLLWQMGVLSMTVQESNITSLSEKSKRQHFILETVTVIAV